MTAPSNRACRCDAAGHPHHHYRQVDVYAPSDRAARLAEALGLFRNGPASDGRGWFRSEDERQELLATAAALLPTVDALIAAEVEQVRARVWEEGFDHGYSYAPGDYMDNPYRAATGPSCRHPLGCQAPGDGCVGPCPVTVSEGAEIERAICTLRAAVAPAPDSAPTRDED